MINRSDLLLLALLGIGLTASGVILHFYPEANLNPDSVEVRR